MARLLFALTLLLVVPAGWGGTTHAGHPVPEAIPEPDVGRLEPAVQQRLRAARDALFRALEDTSSSAESRASQYGELGRVYHAHSLHAEAEACYRNAARLAPDRFDWPYLLGYSYQRAGRFDDAVAAYQRALNLVGDYAPALVRLGQATLEAGAPGQAEPYFETALAEESLKAIAAFWRGKAALAERRYAEAVRWLEMALQADPEASRIHYPLAMAYRGLGDVERARQHIGLRGDIKPRFPDPVVDSLAELMAGARNYLYRGNRAAVAEQYDVAVKEFRRAVMLEPDNVRPRVSLSRALYLTGDSAGAERELERVLTQVPEDAEANYYMGLLREEQGDDEAALSHFGATLAANPDHSEVRFSLANALMRSGDYRGALAHYSAFVEYVPRHLPGRLMEAMALYRTGASHVRVRKRLEAALAASPDDPVFTLALVRLLACSPEAAARDGERALELAGGLYRNSAGPEQAEVLAMAYAELGHFEEAVGAQQAAVTMASWSAPLEVLARLEAGLDGYRAYKPCRTPWTDDDPIFQPPRMDFDALRRFAAQ